jgi:hypothetical protein
MIRRVRIAQTCGLVGLGFGAAVLAALALGLLGAAPAAAQSSSHAGDTLVFQGGEGEVYIAGLPGGWSLGLEESNEFGHQLEWLPAGQPVKEWRDMIAYQLFPELVGMAPELFLTRMAEYYAESCEEVLATDVEGASSNGFPGALRVLACTKNKLTGLGEVTLFRAVKGDRAFYVAQRAWRMDPFAAQAIPVSAEQLDSARKLIEFGMACHKGDAQRPCPPGWEPVLATLDTAKPAVVYKANK